MKQEYFANVLIQIHKGSGLPVPHQQARPEGEWENFPVPRDVWGALLSLKNSFVIIIILLMWHAAQRTYVVQNFDFVPKFPTWVPNSVFLEDNFWIKDFPTGCDEANAWNVYESMLVIHCYNTAGQLSTVAKHQRLLMCLCGSALTVTVTGHASTVDYALSPAGTTLTALTLL